MDTLEPVNSHSSDVHRLSKWRQVQSRLRKTLENDNVFICDVTTHAGWRHAVGVLLARKGSTLGTST